MHSSGQAKEPGDIRLADAHRPITKHDSDYEEHEDPGGTRAVRRKLFPPRRRGGDQGAKSNGIAGQQRASRQGPPFFMGSSRTRAWCCVVVALRIPMQTQVGDPGGNPFFRADLHGFSADSVARAHSASFGSTQSAHAAGVGPPGDVRDRGASFSGDQREPSSNPFQMGAGTPYRWVHSLSRTLLWRGRGWGVMGVSKLARATPHGPRHDRNYICM